MIIIKNAQIIDGTGRRAFRADILLKDNKISAIRTFPNKKADTVIDALGCYVVPGFIDVDTDSDHYLSLFSEPSQKDFLLQGVTTIIGGHCGASLAPLLYGSLESIRKWADPNQINVNWHTVAEFLRALSNLKIGVNFGTLVGHSTIRRALIGETLRDLTDPEIKVFKRILQESLEEGAFGFSTGLGYAHSRQVPYAEIKSLAEILPNYNGIYTTHLRDEKEGLLASINETINIAKETRAKIVISHLRPIIGFEESFEQGLNLIGKNAAAAEVYFDIYPFDTSIIPIYTLLPSWAQNGGLEMMKSNLQTPVVRERIIKDMPDFKEDELLVSQAVGNDYLVGKTLGEFAKNRELGFKEALVELMIVSNLKALLFCKNINIDLVTKSIFNEKAIISSNAATLMDSPKIIKHERATKTFPRFLEIVNQTKAIPLEKAIQKITQIPAALLGLKKRGTIKEGNFADLTILEGAKIRDVVVNGKIAVKEGKLQDGSAGESLKRG